MPAFTAEEFIARWQNVSGSELAARFTGKGGWKKRLPEILQTLVALRGARSSNDRWIGI